MMDLIPESIAVIGMGCHFPGGGHHPKLLWSLLEKGKDCISEIPHDRWDHKQFQYPNVRISQWGGFLQDRQPGECDAAFFDLSPGEATALDPQQRWLLEVSWEALEYGGIDPRQLKNQNVGIFTGISTQDYAVGSLASPDLNTISHYTGTGLSFSTSAGRLSYFYGTHGPAFSIDTACSSSLTAFHQARQSLRIGECDMAIVGGVNAMLTPHLHVYLSKLGVMAEDGRCKTFDRRADGYVRSEGCGVLILKRFKDACRDGNSILAHCLGSAITQCGRGTSLTAPRVSAQEQCIRLALRQAQLSPHQIDYVEAHGTGNPLGDAAELHALGRVFAPGRDKPLRIGSIKSNLGHLEAGAGIAGLIKTILALRHDLMVPNLHYNQPCETLAEYQSLFEIPTQPLPWPRKQIPRRAGISSFGFSGNNAHVILEEAPVPSQQRLFSPHWDGKKPSADRPIHAMALSAISDNALRASTQQMADWLSREEYPLADTCFTMNTGRAHLSHRFAVCGGNPAELRLKLQNAGDEQTGSRKNGTILFFLHPVTGEDIVALREFIHTYPPLHAELESCDKLLMQKGGQSILAGLYHKQMLDEVEQNVVFQTAIAHSLFQLWAMWGVMPAKLIATPATFPASLACSGKISLASSLDLALLLSRENNGGILDYLERTQISKTNIPVELDTGFDSQANGHILKHVQDSLGMSAYAPRHNDNEYGMDLRIGRKTTDIPCFNWRSLCETLCELYMAGWDVDWDAFDRPYARNVVCDLPTYPFQRDIYYINPMEPFYQVEKKNNIPGKRQKSLEIRHRLRLSAAGNRKELLESYVHDTAFHILGNADIADLDRERPLIEQGFDSLTTVELRNRLAKELQLSLPVTLIFNYPTISAIRDYLIDVIPWDNPGESLPTDQLSLRDDKTSESDLADQAPDEQGDVEMQFLDQMNEDELQKWIEDDLESF